MNRYIYCVRVISFVITVKTFLLCSISSEVFPLCDARENTVRWIQAPPPFSPPPPDASGEPFADGEPLCRPEAALSAQTAADTKLTTR